MTCDASGRARGGSVDELRTALQGFTRIGPTGADIFCREAQAVWPELRPFFDERALTSAGRLGYPTTPRGLAALVPSTQVARLSAALVRCPG